MLDRLLDFFVNKLRQGADNLLTAQQQEVPISTFFCFSTERRLTFPSIQRRRETTAALDAFKQQKLGDRIKDLQYVEIICTAPECQGRGYGGALLKNIIAAVCLPLLAQHSKTTHCHESRQSKRAEAYGWCQLTSSTQNFTISMVSRSSTVMLPAKTIQIGTNPQSS